MSRDGCYHSERYSIWKKLGLQAQDSKGKSDSTLTMLAIAEHYPTASSSAGIPPGGLLKLMLIHCVGQNKSKTTTSTSLAPAQPSSELILPYMFNYTESLAERQRPPIGLSSIGVLLMVTDCGADFDRAGAKKSFKTIVSRSRRDVTPNKQTQTTHSGGGREC